MVVRWGAVSLSRAAASCLCHLDWGVGETETVWGRAERAWAASHPTEANQTKPHQNQARSIIIPPHHQKQTWWWISNNTANSAGVKRLPFACWSFSSPAPCFGCFWVGWSSLAYIGELDNNAYPTIDRPINQPPYPPKQQSSRRAMG